MLSSPSSELTQWHQTGRKWTREDQKRAVDVSAGLTPWNNSLYYKTKVKAGTREEDGKAEDRKKSQAAVASSKN